MEQIQLPFSNPMDEINLVISTIYEAGAMINKLYSEGIPHTLKDDNEPVCEADLASNRIIEENLSKTNIPILSEESLDDHARLHSDKLWVVDPLDGTSGFVHRTGNFAVMIGLVKNKKPVFGAIYCPQKDRLFVAQKGEGAYLYEDSKWIKLQVSEIDSLHNSSAVISKFHYSEKELNFLKQEGVSNFKHMSSCMKAMEVAKGGAEFQVAINMKMNQWDTCATMVIIEEAGGKMTDLFGNQLEYNVKQLQHSKGIIISNGKVHEKLVMGYENFLEKL
jgi:3'(2'), 5'-bisphosphate nucleotidase